MASSRTIAEPGKQILPASRPDEGVNVQAAFPRLGLLNGVLIGLALAVGLWGAEVVRLAGIPIPLLYPSLVVAALGLVALFGLAGWITGRIERDLLILIIWLAAGILSTYLITFQPTVGRTLTVWITETRFWGLPIYPSVIDSLLAPVLAGFFIILVLGLLAVLQNYRLEAIAVEVDKTGRLQGRGWFLLFVPLPLVIIAGVVTSAFIGDPSTQALQLVHRAIPVVLANEGDLFELGLQDELNYSAFNSVRDQLSAGYTLRLGETDTATSTTYVVVHFDNGAWVNCRILNEHLSFCFDAAAPYTTGFASLITGAELPDPCPGCLPQADADLQSWLRSKGDDFTGEPQIERVAQWGSFVLMRAKSGEVAIECWFSGFSPVRVDRCAEVAPE